MTTHDSVMLMRHKFESFDKFKEFKGKIKKAERSIKTSLRQGWWVYLSKDFLKYLKDNAIVFRYWHCFIMDCSWKPSIERHFWEKESHTHGHVAIDVSAGWCPKLPLGIRFASPIYILNNIRTKALKKTPYELWHGKSLIYDTWGFWDVRLMPKGELDKLDSRSYLCYFVRYPRETKGYYFYNKL